MCDAPRRNHLEEHDVGYKRHRSSNQAVAGLLELVASPATGADCEGEMRPQPHTHSDDSRCDEQGFAVDLEPTGVREAPDAGNHDSGRHHERQPLVEIGDLCVREQERHSPEDDRRQGDEKPDRRGATVADGHGCVNRVGGHVSLLSSLCE